MSENVMDKKAPLQIEDFDAEGLQSLDQGIQISIAISLKRMADILAEAWDAEKKSP